MASRPLIAASVCLLTVLVAAGAASTTSTATPAIPAAPASNPDKFSGLLANSPFGSARTNAGSTGTEPLEFRAVLEENGNRVFSIYETVSHRSNWVDLNDPVNDFSVKEYDAEHGAVTVEYQGKSLKLSLKRAPIVVSAAPLLPPVPMPGNVAMPANRPAQVTQVPATAPQLQQIREEINRRRALRQQPVATPGTQVTTPPPPNRP